MFFNNIWSFSCSVGRKKMKKTLILFGLLFSIFIFPSDVFAAGEDFYIPYYNKIEDFDVEAGEGETLKNILYENSSVEKVDGDKCFLIYNEQYGAVYHLVCSPKLSDTIRLSYVLDRNSFMLGYLGSDIRYYRFTSDYVLSFTSSSYSFVSSNNSFENVILYSDVNFIFSVNGVDNIYFYDINDSSKIYGQFNTTDLYTYKDFYLTEPNKEVVVFQDNDIHNISKLILGDNVPEEYSFVYTISDYLLVLLFVGIVISPIAIIIKVLRW